MELATLAIDEGQASALLEAHAQPHTRNDLYAGHDAIMVAVCKEVLKGHLIVDVGECVRAGGTETVEHWERFYDGKTYVTEVGPVLMPKLAVSRADATFCWCHAIRKSGNVAFQGVTGWWKTKPAKKESIVLEGVFDQRAEYRLHRRRRPSPELTKRAWLRALVPVVPVAMRPVEGIAAYQILWEAEWTSQPPGDPALLKPLGGTLASVIGVWDLTDLEKAVLAGSRA